MSLQFTEQKYRTVMNDALNTQIRSNSSIDFNRLFDFIENAKVSEVCSLVYQNFV